MITKEQMMPLLLDSCPSFTKKWAEHSADWQDENLPYVDLARFADYLIELHQSNQRDEFPAVFEVIEKLHFEGDGYVKEAITIGLLEAIQNEAEHNQINPEEFKYYLRSETAKWWQQLNDFWKGKIPYVGATIKKVL